MITFQLPPRIQCTPIPTEGGVNVSALMAMEAEARWAKEIRDRMDVAEMDLAVTFSFRYKQPPGYGIEPTLHVSLTGKPVKDVLPDLAAVVEHARVTIVREAIARLDEIIMERRSAIKAIAAELAK